MLWIGPKWYLERAILGHRTVLFLTSPGGVVWGDICLIYRPNCSGSDVNKKLQVSFNKNSRVDSKLTVRLTGAGSTTVFGSLQNVCMATHTSFLFSSHTHTLQLLLLSLAGRTSIDSYNTYQYLFLKHEFPYYKHSWQVGLFHLGPA